MLGSSADFKCFTFVTGDHVLYFLEKNIFFLDLFGNLGSQLGSLVLIAHHHFVQPLGFYSHGSERSHHLLTLVLEYDLIFI